MPQVKATKKAVPANLEDWTDEDRNNVCFAAARLADDADDKVQGHEGRMKKIEDNMKLLGDNVASRIASLVIGGAPFAERGPDAAAGLKAFNDAVKSNLTPEDLQSYQAAFRQYLRKGEPGMSSDMRNAMSVGYEQGGGFLVTPDTTGAVIKALRDTSPIRQLANQQTISTDALEGLIDNDEAESGWVAEQEDRPETKTPEGGKYRIEVQEIYAQPKVTQQLLDDASINVEAWLAEKIIDRFARAENLAFVRGNGSKKPRGFLDYPAVALADKTRPWGKLQYIASGNATGFVAPTATASPADSLIDLVFALKSSYRAGAAFAMNSTTASIVRKWKDSEGRFIWQDSLQSGTADKLLGYPVAFFEDMDDVGAGKFPIAFGNWKRAYTIVDHTVGLRVLRDPFTQKPFVKFYSTKRTGGGVTGFDALKLLKIAAG